MGRINKYLHREGGQSLILLTFGLATLCYATAMAIDLGLFYVERRDIQNAADAAALAGAEELCGAPPAAVSAAISWATANGIDVPGGELAVAQETTYNGDEAIEVEIDRTMETYFWRSDHGYTQFFTIPGYDILGVDSVGVGARAVATANCRGHLRPWGVVEAAVAGLLPGANLTLQRTLGIALPGNYWALAIDGPGPVVYQDTIKYGSDNALCAEDTILRPVFEGDEGYEPPSPDCPSGVETESGLTAAATQSSVQWLMNNTSSDCDQFTEVFDTVVPPLGSTEIFNIKPACNPFPPYNVEASRRVIAVPVIQEIVILGQTEATVVGFVVLWLEGINCPPLGLGECMVATVVVDLMARVPWYRWAKLVE